MHVPCMDNPETFFSPEGLERFDITSATEEERRLHSTILRETDEREKRAQLICLSGCPMLEECRELGRDEPYGVWGGTTPRERKNLREGKVVPRTMPRVQNSLLRQRIVDLFMGGMTIDQVAEVVGLDSKRVRTHLYEQITLMLGTTDIRAVA